MPNGCPILSPLKKNNSLNLINVDHIRMNIRSFPGHIQYASAQSPKNVTSFFYQPSTANSSVTMGGTLRSSSLNWNFNCLDFVTVIYMQPQLLWVHLCNSSVRSKEEHFIILISTVRVLDSFLPLSTIFAEPCWERGWYKVTSMTGHSQPLIFSTLNSSKPLH